MALKQSKQVASGLPTPTATEAGRVVLVTGEYVTATGDAINDIVEFGAIPQNCVPVDLIVDNGALGASATLDAGVISGEYGKVDNARTMGSEFFAGSAAATSGVIRRTSSSARAASAAPQSGPGSTKRYCAPLVSSRTARL